MDSVIAGPAFWAATIPVMLKIPAPTMAPTPRKIRCHGPRTRLSPDASDVASWVSCSRLLVANRGLFMDRFYSIRKRRGQTYGGERALGSDHQKRDRATRRSASGKYLNQNQSI